jgi:hypothetical protein
LQGELGSWVRRQGLRHTSVLTLDGLPPKMRITLELNRSTSGRDTIETADIVAIDTSGGMV